MTSANFNAIAIGTAGDLDHAITLAGGRLLRSVAWQAVADDPGTATDKSIVCVEAESADMEMLDHALPRIDGFATALGLDVVVALGESQIDLVAGHLFGPRVQLLCAPSLAERIAAFMLAARNGDRPPTLSDSWREDAAEHLRDLNDEIARIAEMLAQLVRREPAAKRDVADRRRGFTPQPPPADMTVDPQDLRRLIRTRRLRDQFFGEGLFEDPAWDMLLDLYSAELEGNKVSVSSLCIAAAVAPTTALRWIGKMTEIGLFVRQPDPQDRRRAFMALSNQARDALRGYFAAARRLDTGFA